MKYILIIIALSGMLLATELGFSNDYNAVMKQAEKENKDVYMLITSESCRWCRKFEDLTLSNPTFVKEFKKEYVVLHITRNKDIVPSQFFAKRVPKHYFLTNKGEEIHSFLGYWNVEDFSSFLLDVKDRKKLKGTS